jgi:Holliday junction resolvase RusA-like endonuclease
MQIVGTGYLSKPNFEPRPNSKPYLFKLEGDPIPFFRSRHTKRKSWDHMQSCINKNQRDLSENYTQPKPLHGPIFLNVEFYIPIRYKSESYLIDRPNYTLPQLTRFVQFIEECATKVNILEHEGQIASLFCQKFHSDKPRTEFIFHEICA